MQEFCERYRPTTFNDLIGQPHLSSPDAALRRLCENGAFEHALLYGPPGSGKTSLARIIASSLGAPFYEFNATTLKIEQLRKVFVEHQHSLFTPVVFIDEVHRLAKNQQEVLLPVMEAMQAHIIGASTENLYYSLTGAIRSRALLFELHALGDNAMLAALTQLTAREQIQLDDACANYLIHSSHGDLRAMYKLLQHALNSGLELSQALLERLRPKSQQGGSSEAQVHYDLASALIKSIRGSDVDAGIYYLARLIEGGEPPEFIARRLVILASEDVGNANPTALSLATSCMQAVKLVGYPESRIILAQTVIFLAACPKSNSAYEAINAAQQAIKKGKLDPIPKTIVHDNEGYLYPHNYGGWVEQTYLTQPQQFVALKPIGYEKKLIAWLDAMRQPTK